MMIETLNQSRRNESISEEEGLIYFSVKDGDVWCDDEDLDPVRLRAEMLVRPERTKAGLFDQGLFEVSYKVKANWGISLHNGYGHAILGQLHFRGDDKNHPFYNRPYFSLRWAPNRSASELNVIDKNGQGSRTNPLLWIDVMDGSNVDDTGQIMTSHRYDCSHLIAGNPDAELDVSMTMKGPDGSRRLNVTVATPNGSERSLTHYLNLQRQAGDQTSETRFKFGMYVTKKNEYWPDTWSRYRDIGLTVGRSSFSLNLEKKTGEEFHKHPPNAANSFCKVRL